MMSAERFTAWIKVNSALLADMAKDGDILEMCRLAFEAGQVEGKRKELAMRDKLQKHIDASKRRDKEADLNAQYREAVTGPNIDRSDEKL